MTLPNPIEWVQSYGFYPKSVLIGRSAFFASDSVWAHSFVLHLSTEMIRECGWVYNKNTTNTPIPLGQSYWQLSKQAVQEPDVRPCGNDVITYGAVKSVDWERGIKGGNIALVAAGNK